MTEAHRHNRRNRRTRIQQKNIDRILEAALEVFSRHGYRGSTLDQIAMAAALSKPNLLYYFPSKKAIHRELLSGLLDLWLDPLRGLDPKGEPLAEILSYARRKLEMSRDLPRESRLFANEIVQGAPRIMDTLEGPLKALVDEKAALVESWIAAGRIAPVNPWHLIFSIWSLTQHYADFEVQVRAILKGHESDPFEEAQHYIETLLTRTLGARIDPPRTSAQSSSGCREPARPASGPVASPLNPHMASTFPPPVMEARRWMEATQFPADRPLINVSQAAPADPPPLALRRAIAKTSLANPGAHVYGPVLGLAELRAALADRWSTLYGGPVCPEQVAVTSGCNQAFVATMATLAGAGDEVILPIPWYFNHKMWLDMQGVAAVPLPTGPSMLPDPGRAEALITPGTRAIVLVTPNNPGGVEYPADLIRAFHALCRRRKIALIIDETYRDFLSFDGRPHDLIADPDWDGTLIALYSFSKSYRLTGHRVGAILASRSRLAEVEKFLDTVAICPPQLGQHAALWGLRNLDDWLADERQEILRRRSAMIRGFSGLNGWRLLGCGACFAYAEHPLDAPSERLAKELVSQAGILLLPGTMFMPRNHPDGSRQVRIAFANTDVTEVAALFERFAALAPSDTTA